MSISEADDFLAESETLFDAVAELSDAQLRRPTQFKGWTIEDVLVHLHFWNLAADTSARDAAAFQTLIGRALKGIGTSGFRGFENDEITLRGAALRDAWIAQARDMAPRWAAMDPKARLPWAGPSMSARSSITARQMETWAHGFEVFDALGLTRTEQDRIRNIVVLGANTFGWSHKVHGLAVPDQMPALDLALPSGERMQMGEADAGAITGAASDFAAVVTQTRAVGDTGLAVSGPAASTWMANAQCFAGAPVPPPSPGTRHKQAAP